MTAKKSTRKHEQHAEKVLGYLNFSSGGENYSFLSSLCELFAPIYNQRGKKVSPVKQIGEILRDQLEHCRRTEAFQDATQVDLALPIVFEQFAPFYLEFHKDLLIGYTESSLMTPLFTGRVCEKVLEAIQEGADDEEQILIDATNLLDDYIGYRPVAVLETEQQIQPYRKEYVRPIPLYIRGVGVAPGPYQDFVEKAIEIIHSTDPTILRASFFDPDHFDELAVDTRPYDFDHPNSVRPNYLFGQWDLHCLDNDYNSRRFVIHQLALDGMLKRIESRGRRTRREMVFEEGAILAGTMLMGSGVSGGRPDSHDSRTTLDGLVQTIADYRDTFYGNLIDTLKGKHAERLLREAKDLRQPFGEARQSFNRHIAAENSRQHLHATLARAYAHMGYPTLAKDESRKVTVPAVRVRTDIDCILVTAGHEMNHDRLEEALDLLGGAEALVYRGIECGALIDPWNILGFGGQYNLFEVEAQSMPDHRADELIDIIGWLFSGYVHLCKQAAASGNEDLLGRAQERLARVTEWWDQFATTEVPDVQAVSGSETYESAVLVSESLRRWYAAGTAAGDIAFWRDQVGGFTSPKAYVTVVEALLEQRDPVAAMALLIQWLSESEEVPLSLENYTFEQAAWAWICFVWDKEWPNDKRQSDSGPRIDPERRWPLTQKFIDFLEANAGEYWGAPGFDLGDEDRRGPAGGSGEDEEEDYDQFDEEEDSKSMFERLFEDVSYRDTANDGVEGEVHGRGSTLGDFELTAESERIFERLNFIDMMSDIWKRAASASVDADDPERDEVLAGWLKRTIENQEHLSELLVAVAQYQIPAPRGTQESMVEYDQHRGVKENLLDQIIASCMETIDAAFVIRASMKEPLVAERLSDWERTVSEALRAMVHNDADAVRRVWPEMLESLAEQPLLYVSLARGGHPMRIVATQSILSQLRRLSAYAPRLGLFAETCELIRIVQVMEKTHPVGPGAITEFDALYEIVCKSIVQAISHSLATDTESEAYAQMIDALDEAVEVLGEFWLNHSRGVRLSVMEPLLHDDVHWGFVVRFIKEFGSDLFSQGFLGLRNLRAVLLQTTDVYLQNLLEDPDRPVNFALLTAIENEEIPFDTAASLLETILESVAENYTQYVDYNSSTTQSDRGELLYTLLDFLRLQVHYDRMAWNMQPIVFAHQMLMDMDRGDTAMQWQEILEERSRHVIERLQSQYNKLCKTYGMRLATVQDRLNERFVRPLVIDRIRSLIAPAMKTADQGRITPEIEVFKEAIESLISELESTGGQSVHSQPWLDSLLRDIGDIRAHIPRDETLVMPPLAVPFVDLDPATALHRVAEMRDVFDRAQEQR